MVDRKMRRFGVFVVCASRRLSENAAAPVVGVSGGAGGALDKVRVARDNAFITGRCP